MPEYKINIRKPDSGAQLVLHGVVVNSGERQFDNICELADFLNNARYVEPGGGAASRPFTFFDGTVTRYVVEKWAKEAEQSGCPFGRNDLFVQAPGTSAPRDGDSKHEDTPAAQGAPLKPSESASLTADGVPHGTGRDIAEQYGPLQSELDKQPHDVPASGEASHETTQAGDPVDLFRGAFLMQEVDLTVPNTVLPLVLVRTYRSGQPFPGPFAWNWDHNHNVYLRELDPTVPGGAGNVARWNGDLREDVFRSSGAGFEPPRGVFQQLVKLPLADPRGLYEVRDVGGVSWFFDRPSGWSNPFRIPLVRMVDRFGNALEYAYDADDRVSRVTCVPLSDGGSPSAGPHHYLEFTYGNCGLLEHVSDSVGREVAYDHDPDLQRMVRVRYPATPDHPDGTQRAYHYGLHLPEALRHNVVRVEDGHGKVYVENAYEDDPSAWSYGHLVRQLHGGNLYRFTYTPLQWLPPADEHLNIPVQRTEVLDPAGGLTTYTFNYRGDMLDRRTRLAADGSYRITAMAFEYDAQGNRVRAQHLREFSEDAAGNVVHLWGLGERREYFHDHADPRMRGLLRRTSSLDGNMAETTWEGTYDPNLQLPLTERGPVGDGFTAADVTTTYHYSADNTGRLERITAPAVTLPDGSPQTSETRFETNARGQTTAVITPEGTRHELFYEPSGLGIGRLVRKVGDVAGAAAEQRMTYDARGFLESITDPTGAVTTFAYNALGQLIETAPPAIAGVAPTTRLHYDGDGGIVEVERPRGSYTDATLQGDHIVDRVVRNVLGHVVRSEIGANTALPRLTLSAVDHRGLPLRVTDPLGAVTARRYDERGLPFDEEVRGSDGANHVERTVYTRDGRVARRIGGPLGDAVTEYVYGPFGRLARTHRLHRDAAGTETPAGATQRTVYNDRGGALRSELRAWPGLDADELLARTEFSYDARGRLIARTERPFSAAAPFDDALTPKLTTSYYHDAEDRVVKIVDPRGGVTTYAYDGLGRLTAQQDPEGNRVEYAYDPTDRSLTTTRRDKEPGSPTLKDRSWRRRSDARGRLVETIEPDGAAARFEYDDRDLLTAMVDRDGTRTEFAYGLLNELTTETLDPAGLNLRAERAYDLVGRMTASTDPSGQTTTYAYDGIGRMVRTQGPGDAAPRTMTYGPDGRLASGTLPSGITMNYAYDAAGRLASLAAANVPAGVLSVPVHTYAYDLLGRLTTATAGAAVVTRTWDSLGRPLSETTHGERLEAAYDDAAGTLTRAWPDGRRERLTTDLNGAATKIERTAAGALGAGAAILGEFTPYGPALVGKAALLGGVETAFTYDERMRLGRVAHSKGAAVLEAAEYRHDTMDRRRLELMTVGAARTRAHTFDARRRLTRTLEGAAAIAPGTDGYTQAGNDADIAAVEAALATATPSPLEYRIDYTAIAEGKADARLELRVGPYLGAQTSTAYTYTNGHRPAAAGSETFAHTPDGVRTADANNAYAVDAFGRVRRITDASGATVRTEIEYDPLGRVGALTPAAGGTRKLSYFGGSLWQERDAAGPVRQFTHHPGLPGPMAAHTAGESYLLLHDARMNLLAATDSGGTVRRRFGYEPYGTPTATGTATDIEPRFGGMRWLADGTLYLAGARLMDPRHGAWLSHDPLGAVDSPNLYAYAAGNPIDFADPTGLATGKGGGGGNSDGGMGAPSFAGASPRIQSAHGSSMRSAAYGPGTGGGIGGPAWLISVTDSLRDFSNAVRDAFGKIVDATLGKIPGVGDFLGGLTKRLFDYGLMVTPAGYAVWEEEIGGMASMYGMTVDALFSPDPERYNRLGDMLRAMPDAIAHMSAAEWGSLAADFVPQLLIGGIGVGRVVARLGVRGAMRLVGRGLRRMFTRASTRGMNGLRSPAMRILNEEEIAQITREFVEIGGDPSMLRFNEGRYTGYHDGENVIFVRGDVFPASGNPTHPRSAMSSKAVLAHEYYGHAAHRGTIVPQAAWNDEFRASYRAALDAPGLTDLERAHLMRDAMMRASEKGVTITPNRFMLGILYGY